MPAVVYERKAIRYDISEVDAQIKCSKSEYVLGIFDHFVIGETLYIVTVYESGKDLCDYINAQGQDRLTEEHALYIFT